MPENESNEKKRAIGLSPMRGRAEAVPKGRADDGPAGVPFCLFCRGEQQERLTYSGKDGFGIKRIKCRVCGVGHAD